MIYDDKTQGKLWQIGNLYPTNSIKFYPILTHKIG